MLPTPAPIPPKVGQLAAEIVEVGAVAVSRDSPSAVQPRSHGSP
jgi:hypothetical protein